MDLQVGAPGWSWALRPLLVTEFAVYTRPGLDSGDCGDNGAIRHDGPVQLYLLGRCDAGAWSGRGGSAQVVG